MTTHTHLCVSVRGMLHWSARETRRNLKSITKHDGTRYRTVSEFRNALMDELAQGREVLPLTNPPCEGFSFKTGCPGHPQEEETSPDARPQQS
jgi:hypothetical protein